MMNVKKKAVENLFATTGLSNNTKHMTMVKLCFLLLITSNNIYAQTKEKVNDFSVIKTIDWIIPKTDTLDYSFETFAGTEKTLILKRNILNYKSASIAYPKELEFRDGIIELDLASPNGKNGFVGFAFRIKDPHHYETVYFRSGSSGTINAIQYMPEKQAEFNWWNYEDEKYQGKAILL